MKDILKKAFIGVGSNIFPENNIIQALILLSHSVNVISTSTFYITRPLLNKNQADFYNGVWQIKTSYKPEDLKFKILKLIERKLKRTITIDKYVSRTIDLDLIFYDNQVIKQKNLIIPDPDIYTRSFVAIPLFELDPELILPDTKESLFNIVAKIMDRSLIPNKEFTEQLRMIIQSNK
jgi:2-amino-4-hydroxy-6-hydroxymethyldihydropteridine diphosphokinase